MKLTKEQKRKIVQSMIEAGEIQTINSVALKAGLANKKKYENDPEHFKRIGKLGGRPRKLSTDESGNK